MVDLKKIDRLIKQVGAIEKQYKKLNREDLLKLKCDGEEETYINFIKRLLDIDITERILNVSQEQLEEAEKLSISYREYKGAFKYSPYEGYKKLIISLLTTEELKEISSLLD